MTAPTDSAVPTKIVSINHTFFWFLLHSFHFIADNYYYGSLFRKSKKMKMFLLFTKICPKINMNVVKTISPQQQFANVH